MKVLVTGGLGFIGSNFIRYSLAEHDDWWITNLDKVTYAVNPRNLADLESNARYRFIKGDIGDRDLVNTTLGQGYDTVVNFAAESHVDRSILDPSPFVETNVRGTQVLLEAAKQRPVGRFLQVSTDEVYGSLGRRGKFREDSRLLPNSPYAASKGAADLMCRAYYHTSRVPVVITRSSNNFGPRQFPEKLVALAITNIIEGRTIPIYGDGLNVRDWLYVEDNCRALDRVIQKGEPGEIYNIAGNCEKTNLQVVEQILDIMHRPRDLVTFVADRPGHDRRYAMHTDKIERELGWKQTCSFEDSIEKTVDWYVKNEHWWRELKGEAYSRYYDKVYHRS